MIHFDEVKEIIGQPESTVLEYKSTLPTANSIARDIAAFANTEGGWLIIGVQESRNQSMEVIGVPYDIPALAVIESSLMRLKPKPRIDHNFIKFNGKNLYVIKVEKISPLTIAENGKIFRRIGAAIQQSTPKENKQGGIPYIETFCIEVI